MSSEDLTRSSLKFMRVTSQQIKHSSSIEKSHTNMMFNYLDTIQITLKTSQRVKSTLQSNKDYLNKQNQLVVRSPTVNMYAEHAKNVRTTRNMNQ